MKRILLALLLVLVSGSAFASESVLRFRRDTSFLQGGRLQAIQWVNPCVPDTSVVAASVMLDSCATTTRTFSAVQAAAFEPSSNDGWARTIDVTIASRTGVSNDIKGATLTITGTNILSDAITEAYTITNNTANTVAGTKAFKTVVSFTVGAMDDDSVAVSFGHGAKLGLWNTLPFDSMVLAWNGTSADASAAVTPDDDEIEKVIIDFNADPTGTSDHGVLYWIPPFSTTTTIISQNKY